MTPNRTTVGLLLLIVAPLLAWGGAAVWLDQAGARAPRGGPYDYVVVAGAGVLPGGVASDALEARTRLAAELWQAGVAPKVAFTGGVGDFPPSEARVAAALAESLGVPRGAMVWEERSTSTEENASELARALGDAHVLVVTDRYHVFRCVRVFSRYFREVDGVGATSPPAVRVRGALREVLAIGLYGAQGRLGTGG